MRQGKRPMAEPANPDALIRTRIFAESRASAGVLCQGPETKFRPCWFPKLAQQFVRNADDPKTGYNSRDDALAAARRYRTACRELIGDA
jgi:hypothetical protein